MPINFAMGIESNAKKWYNYLLIKDAFIVCVKPIDGKSQQYTKGHTL
jgi:hypothetical protein